MSFMDLTVILAVLFHSCSAEGSTEEPSSSTDIASTGLMCYVCNGIEECALPVEQLQIVSCGSGSVCAFFNVTADFVPGGRATDIFRDCVESIEGVEDCVTASRYIDEVIRPDFPNFRDFVSGEDGVVCYCVEELCNSELGVPDVPGANEEVVNITVIRRSTEEPSFSTYFATTDFVVFAVIIPSVVAAPLVIAVILFKWYKTQKIRVPKSGQDTDNPAVSTEYDVDDYTIPDQKQAEGQQSSYEPLKNERNTSTKTYIQDDPFSGMTYSHTIYKNKRNANTEHAGQTSASEIADSYETADGIQQNIYEEPDNSEDTSADYIDVCA